MRAKPWEVTDALWQGTARDNSGAQQAVLLWP